MGRMKEVLEESGNEATWEHEGDYTDSQRADSNDTRRSNSLDATIERLDQLVIKHRKFFDKEQFDECF